MRYYTLLSDEDIRKVCFCYTHKELINGFKKCSKDFSAVLPGRRPQSMSEEAGRNLIANNPHSNLTAKMVEALLSYWVPRITASVKKQIEVGKDSDYAYIVSFSEFGFPSFVDVYFHVIKEDISEERIIAIRAGVEALSDMIEHTSANRESESATKKADAINRQQSQKLKEKDQEIKHKTSEIKALTKALAEARSRIESLLEENKRIALLEGKLSEAASEIDRLRSASVEDAKRLEEVRRANERFEEQLQASIDRIAAIQSELEASRNQLSEMEQSKKDALDLLYSETTHELRPVDMDEFIEYLSYNLSSVGVNKDEPYFPLLLHYLENVLFKNKPIICNQAVGHTLAKCLSNTLCGNPNATIIPYKEGISHEEIRAILETDSRILVFDSFIGNYSEMELFPLLRSAKRKIIFITSEYDKTIAYLLPEEVLLNCTYINTNNIPELFTANGLDEDPSTIKEELTIPVSEAPNRRAQRLCKEIMLELGFSSVVANVLAEQMSSEEKLDGFLAFSIIPYAIEAYGISPYNASDRLGKYAGPAGKCVQKELFGEWYGNV